MASELKIRPLGDKILIKVLEETQTTLGGIILPDSAREKPQKGEVVAVGTGRTLDNGNKEPMDVKVGETVLFAKYGGSDIKFEGTEYKILSIRDILGIIE
ncbi:MAG TPA: co-chaperone GroES [Cyanobacteria bacterium UBA9971]|nr:MAG: co-chaperone GroES [Candidatus Melainabacteria bacterium GWA2_34_9]HBG48005.1 co-chaperone GroES [Cyanobacteria bacterium UBA9971]